MREGGRIAAAIEVLGEVAERHRPAALALADWGRAHRFAGSGDRAAIGNLVFDALRRKATAAWLMDADTPRALALGALRLVWGLTAAEIAALFDGSEHAPSPLSEHEHMRLAADPGPPPPEITADVPAWLLRSLERAFGERAAKEGAALARRAPVDLRVNTLKATRDKVLGQLARHAPVATPLSPVGIRIAHPPRGGRAPNVEAEAAHGRGLFEVQDEGSQIAALLTGAGPRMQVADVCAGAGGKTLALAATMRNQGQIHAYDSDRTRLRPIFERLQRAGVRNCQVLEAGVAQGLAPLAGRMDVVLVDAPCTGSGVWRRRPDAKWRLKPGQLAERQAEQTAVLELAAPLVRPGGRLVYVTCSMLPEENADQVAALLARRPELALVPYADAWTASLPGAPAVSADGSQTTLQLTPARHATDGFFVAVLERRPG